MSATNLKKIDALLPQTQCGLCGYAGCLPYAQALAENAAPINLCPPGGIKTLRALGELLNQDPTPFLVEMAEKAKPPQLAVIREDECIGCTKCINACPVDAILGSTKTMHTVLAAECTGCELCVAPCPVDCIEIIAQTDEFSEKAKVMKANLARERFYARQKRLMETKEHSLHPALMSLENTLISKREYIKAAINRAKVKKL